MSSAMITMTISLLVLMAGCGGSMPKDIGVRNNRLADCPPSPNCVSSRSPDAGQAVDPLTYSTDADAAMKALKDVIASMKRTRIRTEAKGYLHVEFTSALFRFVDDVEFLIDEQARLIHVRSASRIGHSDLGANRKRVERIRTLWQQVNRQTTREDR